MQRTIEYLKDRFPIMCAVVIVIIFTPYLKDTILNDEVKWAFSFTKGDEVLSPGEECRESLAQKLRTKEGRSKLSKKQDSNIYRFLGENESYYIAAFKNKEDCITALDLLKK